MLVVLRLKHLVLEESATDFSVFHWNTHQKIKLRLYSSVSFDASSTITKQRDLLGQKNSFCSSRSILNPGSLWGSMLMFQSSQRFFGCESSLASIKNYQRASSAFYYVFTASKMGKTNFYVEPVVNIVGNNKGTFEQILIHL